MAISDIQGNITYVNQACLTLWRKDSKEELLGKSFWELLELEDAVVAQDIAKAMIENGSWKGELAARRKDGSKINVQVLTTIIKDERGNPVQTMSSFIDVTERKKIEQQLQLVARLASVGELAAGVAHELNNPLAAIHGYAELLTERQDFDDSTKKDIETIFKEAQRAARITSNLLSFARKHTPQKTLSSMNEVLEKTLEMYAYRLKVNNIDVLKEFEPNLPEGER